MKKRFLRQYTQILALFLCLLLCACGKTPTPETTAPETTEAAKSFASADFPEELKQHLSPWDLDAPALAKKDGRIHYYFMCSLGMVIDEASSYPPKWGDACLIVFPNGQTMLVDSGHNTYAPVLVENLKRLGIQRLDYVFFSHEHIDHVGGALTEGGVFDHFPVGKVFWSGITYPGGHSIREGCEKRGITLKAMRKGSALRIGEVRLEMLWPEVYITQESTKTVKAQNNHSAVFRLEYGSHSSLFPGDLYVFGEEQLLKAVGEKLDVDLAKICHHGQDTSSSEAFVQMVSPKLAVATGFVPIASTAEEAYLKTGAKVLFDRYHGYIHVTSDGTDLVHEPI